VPTTSYSTNNPASAGDVPTATIDNLAATDRPAATGRPTDVVHTDTGENVIAKIPSDPVVIVTTRSKHAVFATPTAVLVDANLAARINSHGAHLVVEAPQETPTATDNELASSVIAVLVQSGTNFSSTEATAAAVADAAATIDVEPTAAVVVPTAAVVVPTAATIVVPAAAVVVPTAATIDGSAATVVVPAAAAVVVPAATVVVPTATTVDGSAATVVGSAAAVVVPAAAAVVVPAATIVVSTATGTAATPPTKLSGRDAGLLGGLVGGLADLTRAQRCANVGSALISQPQVMVNIINRAACTVNRAACTVAHCTRAQ
jgi:hypothetical protein